MFLKTQSEIRKKKKTNTLEYLRSNCGLKRDEMSNLTPAMVRKNFNYMTPPVDEQWRVTLMKELISVRNAGYVDVPGFTSSELEDMLTSICSD